MKLSENTVRLLNIVFMLSIALHGFTTARAADFVWTGGAADSKWTTAANWTSGGVAATAAPGESDTAIFNSTSSADCNIDADFGGIVNNIKIESGYGGTVSLGRELTVKNEFTQSDGTFVCANNDFTIGVFGVGSTSGKFTLAGGTFNCPSGEFKWRPIRTSNAANFTISAGTWNHNNGTFIVDWDYKYTYDMLGQMFIASNREFNNFTVRSAASGTFTVSGTNNIIKGEMVFSGNMSTVSNMEITGLGSFFGNFVAKGNVTVNGACRGGNLTVEFDSDEDQEIYFSNESESSQSRGFGLVVNKPGDKKVIVKAATKNVFLGLGSSTWNCIDNLGYRCLSGIYVKRGILDFSNVTNLQINSDNSAYFAFADGGNVLFPENVSHSMRMSANYTIADGLVFTNLSFFSAGNSPYFPKASTNTVVGRLSLDAATFATAQGSTEIQSPDAWISSGMKVATLAVHGDVEIGNSSNYSKMGGTGKILLCSDSDQKIHIRKESAALPTLNINKPSGSVICIPEDESWPLKLASAGDTANGGSLVIESGDVKLPKAGLEFANLHNQLFMRTGGSIDIASCPLKISHRGTLTYSLYISGIDAVGDLILNGQVLRPLNPPLKILGDLTLTRSSTAQKPYIATATTISAELSGDKDQNFYSTLDYCAIINTGSSVSGGIGLAKTGGSLILKSPLTARNITVADAQKIRLDIPETFSGAMISASRSLSFPGAGKKTVLELCKKPRTPGYAARDVFSYVNGVDGYDETAFEFILPPAVTKAKVLHDKEAKLITFSAKVSCGTSVIVR